MLHKIELKALDEDWNQPRDKKRSLEKTLKKKSRNLIMRNFHSRSHPLKRTGCCTGPSMVK